MTYKITTTLPNGKQYTDHRDDHQNAMRLASRSIHMTGTDYWHHVERLEGLGRTQMEDKGVRIDITS